MPFDLRNYLSLFGRSFRDNRTPRRFLRVLVLAIGFPLVNLFANVGMALDYVFFPAFRKATVRTPIFIIGHARSGTTLMHTLLARDAEVFTAWRVWELTMPSITQKVLVRWLMGIDREYFGSWLERKITQIEDRAFAKGRQMHPMGLRIPEEDAFMMIPTFMQSQLGFWFPYPEIIDHLYYMDEHQSPRDVRNREKLMRFYRGAITRQIHYTGGRTVFLSKNPCFTGSIQTLRSAFPDARFIVMMRNPYQTIPSLLKLMSRNFRAMGLSKQEIAKPLELLAAQALHYYRYPLEVLADAPPDRAVFVPYTDLIESPSRTLKATLGQLGFSVSPHYEQVLRDEDERSKEHRAEHVYSLEEFGLTREEIRAALPEAFARFGWEEPVSTE